MSDKRNWFEDNPTKSVILYTIAIIGAVWAFSKFVLEDNKISLKNTQIESVKQEVEQYKAKLEIASDDNEKLRLENQRLLEWLQETPNTIPFYENKIIQLEGEMQKIEESPRSITKDLDLQLNVLPYSIIGSIRRGETFIDEKTQVSISVSDVSITPLSISGILNLPEESIELNQEIVGKKWNFSFNETQYILIIESINWYSDTCKIRIEEKKSK